MIRTSTSDFAAEVSELDVDELLMAASQLYEAEEKELRAVERENNGGERDLDIDRLLMAAAQSRAARGDQCSCR